MYAQCFTLSHKQRIPAHNQKTKTKQYPIQKRDRKSKPHSMVKVPSFYQIEFFSTSAKGVFLYTWLQFKRTKNGRTYFSKAFNVYPSWRLIFYRKNVTLILKNKVFLWQLWFFSCCGSNLLPIEWSVAYRLVGFKKCFLWKLVVLKKVKYPSWTL